MAYVFNPFTGNFDVTGSPGESTQSTGFYPYSNFVCGKISDLEEGFDNFINCCSLPIDSTRQTIDLGTIDELCN